MATKIELRVARDGGEGQRGISHRRENPYDAKVQPEQHAAWESGWEKADREANEQAARLAAKLGG